jgi:hypothetical protein
MGLVSKNDRLAKDIAGRAQIAFVWLQAVAIGTVVYFFPLARLLDSLAMATAPPWRPLGGPLFDAICASSAWYSLTTQCSFWPPIARTTGTARSNAERSS